MSELSAWPFRRIYPSFQLFINILFFFIDQPKHGSTRGEAIRFFSLSSIESLQPGIRVFAAHVKCMFNNKNKLNVSFNRFIIYFFRLFFGIHGFQVLLHAFTNQFNERSDWCVRTSTSHNENNGNRSEENKKKILNVNCGR